MYHSVDNEKGKGGIFVDEFEESLQDDEDPQVSRG